MQEKHISRGENLKTAFDQICDCGLNEWVASNGIEALEELLGAFEESINEKLQKSMDSEMLQGVSPRERLFEIMLTRFEYMSPYKGGLRALVDEGWQYPRLVLRGLCLEQQGTQVILKLADIAMDGPIGYAKEKIILGVYLLTFHKWLEDQTESLEVTMAFLDQALGWCDKQMERYG